MKEEKVAASVFIVMHRDLWPRNLEQIKVYATRELARDVINARGNEESYLERDVIEIKSCPHCGAEKGG